MSRYTVWVSPSALREIKNLPGYVRQRAKRAVSDLADDPCPPDAVQLDLPDADVSVWRLRFDRWRIIYVIADADRAIDVLAIRRRPPYDYADIAQLLAELN